MEQSSRMIVASCMGNTAPAPAAGSRPGSAEEGGGCGPLWPLQLHEYSRPRHRHYHRRSSTMNIRAAGICSPESNRERLIFSKKVNLTLWLNAGIIWPLLFIWRFHGQFSDQVSHHKAMIIPNPSSAELRLNHGMS